MKVIVGMSGGVDSAVSALLLREAGHHVEGLFMTNWDTDDAYCTNAEDLQSAAAVCRELGIVLHRVDFAAEYREAVFRYFLDEYSRGRTPNPDVLCNREIKFGVFRRHAKRLGAERIATGHYARLGAGDDGLVRLLKGCDARKDQTYFLHAVGQEALRETLFPIGHLEKEQVRAVARDQGLPNFDRRDSTGICFIGERPFREFLARYLPAQPGEIRTVDGEPVGRHEGLMFYTLGQRRGLGLGGRADGDDAPWYVVDKDVEHNVLRVAQGEPDLLFSRALLAASPHWIAGAAPALPLRCEARVRYRQTPQACVVEGGGDGLLRVTFDEPQRAVTPGQFVVFYDGEVCLGGATIERALARGDRGRDAAPASQHVAAT